MKKIILLFLISQFFFSTLFSQEIYPNWKHFYVDPILPGGSWGTGGPAVADFDGDGDLDLAISRRNTKSAYWYEQKNDSIWIQHLIGTADNLANTLGTTTFDINHDGFPDVLFNGIWFQNPGNLKENPEMPWSGNLVKAGGHDAMNADINGDEVSDILVFDGNILAWYNASESFREYIISSGNHDHGGSAPNGFGDIDNDGDIDVIIPGFWFANAGDGVKWEQKEWPFHPVKNASYGPSARSWVADINLDGQLDIVYAHCDTGGSHLYWVENKGNGEKWVSHQLSDPPTREGDIKGTGSFHSLIVADFNQDGKPDIFAGEQEDPDTYMEEKGKVAMKPRGLKPRGTIWYNQGGKNPGFEMYVIHVGNPGWHDAQAADIDGDGDLDIVSKIWKADGLSFHLDYWRNELKK